MATSVTFDIRGNASSFLRAMGRAARGVRDFSGSAAAGGSSLAKFSGAFGRFNSALLRVLRSVALLQTNMLGLQGSIMAFDRIRGTVRTFASLEEGLLKIKAVTGSTDEEMKDLRGQIEKLGFETKFMTRTSRRQSSTWGLWG